MKISSAGLLTAGGPLVTPDFKIHTSAMEIDPEQGNIVRMIGSSTERDLHGDTMAISALSDMATVEPGLTIWLNHSYDVPNDLFGSLMESPRLELQNGIADIHIKSDVEMDNPAAAQTLKLVKNNRKLGCSIGCMVLECEIDEENDDGHSWYPPLIITHVQTLEWSVVGIPANQRCWVEMAAKGLFERLASQDRGDEALRLAPAVKGLYPKAYEEYLKKMSNEPLRKDLERVTARPTSNQRVEWLPAEKMFAMSTKGSQKSQVLNRNEVTALMAKGIEMPRIAKPAVKEETTVDQTEKTEIKSVDPIESVDTDIKEEAEEITVSEETATADNADADTEVTETSVEVEEESPVEAKAEEHGVKQSPADALKVQMYNLLASELGQPQLVLDAQGQIAAPKAFPELTPESVQEVIAKTLNFVEVTKGGSEFSKENREKLQSLHDGMVQMCKSSFHPCKEMEASEGSDDGDSTDNPDDGNGGDEQKQFGQLLDIKSEIGPLHVQVTDLRKDVAALVDVLVKNGIDPKALKETQRQLKDIQAQTKAAEERAKAAEEHLAKLANVPLGQPTLLRRGVQQNGDVATYDDFKALSAASMNSNERRWSLDEALKATIVVPRTLGSGEVMNYRKWPEGVGGSIQDGVRPELTSDQRKYMHGAECLAYRDGKEACVPCYDDPLNVPA
jgi:hypothetical protein